jgi:hypothetical protein
MRLPSGRCGGGAWVVAAALAACGAAGSARAQVAARSPRDAGGADTVLRVTLPADTILFSTGERLPIVVRPGRPMAIVASVASVTRPAIVLWRSDTVPAGATVALAWDVGASGTGGLDSGRYLLAVAATDSTGVELRAQRTLVVTRLAADTLPLPQALAPRELEPESVEVRQVAPWAIFIGAGAGLLPSLFGRHELNDGRRGDAKAWLVVGTVTVAGFVAFFAGHRQEFAPENAARNAQRRREREARLTSVREANARARAAAPYRIQVEGGGP